MKMISLDYKFMMFGAALLFVPGVALAQDGAAHERVTVDGPYTISHATGAAAFGDGVSISRIVSYADLDLTTASGHDAMNSRVKDAAKDVCRELDRRYPMGASDSRECARVAAGNALNKVGEIVASLERAARVASLH